MINVLWLPRHGPQPERLEQQKCVFPPLWRGRKSQIAVRRGRCLVWTLLLTVSSCGGGSPAAPSSYVRTLALLAYVPPLEPRSRVRLLTGPISKHRHTGGWDPNI